MAKNEKKLGFAPTLNEEAMQKVATMFPHKEAPELRKINIEKPSIRETKSTPSSPRLDRPIEISIFSKSSLDAISKNSDDSNFAFEIKHKIRKIAEEKHKNKQTKHYEEDHYFHHDDNETGIIISVEKITSDEVKPLGSNSYEIDKHINNSDNYI